MKYMILALLTFQVLEISAQDVSFYQTTIDTIYGNELEKIYRCFGGLVNESNDSVTIKYTRIRNELSARNLYSGFCTDIFCYFVSDELVYEKIPPLDTHHLEIRWNVRFEDIISGEGHTEWEIINEDKGAVIDTFYSDFKYSSIVTSADDLTKESIRVHPNPVSVTLKFLGKISGKVVIYNSYGALVKQSILERANTFDVSVLQAGMYFGSLKNENKSYNFQFSKL